MQSVQNLVAYLVAIFQYLICFVPAYVFAESKLTQTVKIFIEILRNIGYPSRVGYLIKHRKVYS